MHLNQLAQYMEKRRTLGNSTMSWCFYVFLDETITVIIQQNALAVDLHLLLLHITYSVCKLTTSEFGLTFIYNGNESSCSIKCTKFFDKLRNC